MPQARGSQAAVTLFEETTFATDPGTPDGKKLYFTSADLSSGQNLMDSETLGASRERSRPIQGNITVDGSLDMEIGAENIGTLFKHALGQNVDSGTGPYTHILTLGNLPTGLTLEKDFGSNISGTGRYEKFNGCRIKSLALDFPAEGFPKAQFGIVGAKSALASSALDATITDYGHTPFSAFEATILEGGSAIAVVTAAKINLDNDLDESAFAIGGGGVRRSLPEGFSTVTGEITALFEDPTLLNKAINRTASSLKITLSRGTGLGSAGNESIEFFVQNLDYQRKSPGISGPKGVLITLPFKAYKVGGTTAFQITLKNAVATL